MTANLSRGRDEAGPAPSGGGPDETDLVEVGARVLRHALLLPVDSAGILVAAGDRLELLAATSETARDLELAQAQRVAGPCLLAFRTGEPVSVPDLHVAAERWPEFAAAAAAHDVRSMHAVPLLAGERPFGALGLFRSVTGGLSETDTGRAAALADLIGQVLVTSHLARSQAATARHLQRALDARVLIEQAKGVLMASAGLPPEVAFEVLRRRARSSGRRAADIARDVVSGAVTVPELMEGPAGR